jgi:hypothetical protein
MVDWKLYIDSPQKSALELCGGSLTQGADGWGNGYGCGNIYGIGYGWIDGDGRGDGYGWGDGGGAAGSRDGHGPLAHRGGDGVSANEW